MTAFSRNLTAFARAFFVAAILVILPAPLALAQEDGSHPATKADIRRLETDGKRRDAKLDALTANMAELTKNVAVLAEKMSGLNEKVEAQGVRLNNMQNSLDRINDRIILGLLGIIGSIIGAGWWANRKSASHKSTSEREDSPNSHRTNHNLAIGLVPNDLIASITAELRRTRDIPPIFLDGKQGEKTGD